MNTIKTQWHEMIERGTIPVIEYPLKDEEFLTVDLSIDEKGIVFEFDDNDKPVYFDGEIKQYGDGTYTLPFDTYFEDLHYYREMIDQNIREGFLMPNDLQD